MGLKFKASPNALNKLKRSTHTYKIGKMALFTPMLYAYSTFPPVLLK